MYLHLVLIVRAAYTVVILSITYHAINSLQPALRGWPEPSSTYMFWGVCISMAIQLSTADSRRVVVIFHMFRLANLYLDTNYVAN